MPRQSPAIQAPARTLRSQAVKNEGNEFFKAARFKEALEKYNDAIDLNPEAAIYYCNRAFCHIKMENHGCAIEDAGVALELDRQCAKAYYRRGAAYMALAKYKKALKDYSSLKQLKPRCALGTPHYDRVAGNRIHSHPIS